MTAISGGRIGMPQRADLNPAELDFDEEKFITLDAVPCTGARRLLRTRSKTLRIIIPRPSLTQTGKPIWRYSNSNMQPSARQIHSAVEKCRISISSF